jgi:hypothetical protein
MLKFVPHGSGWFALFVVKGLLLVKYGAIVFHWGLESRFGFVIWV